MWQAEAPDSSDNDEDIEAPGRKRNQNRDIGCRRGEFSGQTKVLGIEDLFHVYFSCFCVDASVTCSDVRGAYILIAL